MRFAVAPLLLMLAVSAAAERNISPRQEALMKDGIDALYRMDYARTEEVVAELKRIDPEHPYAYFGHAGLAWVRYLYESEQSDQALVAVFERRLDLALEKCEAWLDLHPEDSEVWLVHGAALGLRSRFQLVRSQWLGAFFTGRKAMKYVRKALKIDPDLHDAKLGVGTYEYYTDTLGRFVRPIARLVLGGSRVRGLERVREVARDGRFMATTAKIWLVEVYLADKYGLRDPKRAKELVAEVRAKYPESPMIHGAQITVLYETGDLDGARREAEAFLERARSGAYPPAFRAKGGVFLGVIEAGRGERDKALAAFREAAQVEHGGRLSRWAVWALIRAGQIDDLLGRRDAARELYRKAAADANPWGFKKVAEKFLERAYDPERDGRLTMWPEPDH